VLRSSLNDGYLTLPILQRARVTLLLAVYRQSVRLGAEALETHGQNFFSQLNTCDHSPYIASCLTRGWVCYLQLLLALTRAFILVSESRGTRDHILLSQIRDFPFPLLLRLAGLRWRYSAPPPHANRLFFKVKVKVMLRPTVQSASLSSNKAPIWVLGPDLYYSQTVAGLLIWGALSDERTGLPFTISAGPRQRSHSRVLVPWDSPPYFTVSDLRLPLFVASYDSQGYSGGILLRLHTEALSNQSQSHIVTDGQSVS
jgi:hypothetical protein